jgi:tetratricopeptide (TPR) repeat protein
VTESQDLSSSVACRGAEQADRLHLLGVTLYQSGDVEQAAGLIARAIAIRSDVANYHGDLGNALRVLGRLPEAVASYRTALTLEPTLADAYAGLGTIYYHQGMLAEAIACLERACALAPGIAGTHNSLGYALHVQGRHDAARRSYERALALDPRLADAWNNLGFTLQAQGQSEAAIDCYERALGLDPGFAEAANNLGNAQKECGRFDQALASYDRAIAARPRYAQAHFNRADGKTFQAGDPDLEALQRLADASAQLPADEAPYVHFALAKALDDVGETDRAFEQLLRGNALKRATLAYEEATLEAFLMRIRAVFDRPFMESCAGAGDPSELPVFIIGMPRSGSTLVEQVLASHPQVQSAGECTHLEQAAFRRLDAGPPGRYPESIRAAGPSVLRDIARDYLARLPTVPAETIRVIDKLPGNFMHVGLIKAVLPNARIIHVSRDPLDTCLSCFSKLFREGQAFSYDLAELGRYYRRYAALMRHWHEVLPAGSLLEVSYEAVVADLPAEARRMVDFCGLGWDDQCLAFHRNSRVVATASAVQVRQPLFSSSVGRSRRYVAQLQPLVAALEA